jgi:hypothetical protein
MGGKPLARNEIINVTVMLVFYRFAVLVPAVFVFSSMYCTAQVSHGGKPLPLTVSKAPEERWFEEMPAFDVAEELRRDSLEGNNLRSGYRFAYKFMTGFNRSNSGVSFVLPDGTRVWRLGIRSGGAFSINVLFTEYELPEGAQLFLYNKERTHILGAFNHLNNSELGILPVSPVEGDELVIEYQEPANVPFAGRLTVGEVNHAYRSLRREPDDSRDSHACMQPLTCFYGDSGMEELGRSVVLLMIDGTTSCSGVMVNNTSGDGKPYLLTASHCINKNFTVTDPEGPEGFDVIAGSVVCYFNYDSPLCGQVLRGTEEMSVASARCVVMDAVHDAVLLELLETPPVYYRPYYAGWNLSEKLTPPYFGIHHPNASVKRMSWMDNDIELDTFDATGLNIEFEPRAHWHIDKWTSGCTAGGSSGSPLFDTDGHVIGALSGGYSYCDTPVDDYYFALSKAWEPEGNDNPLKHWLDPDGRKVRLCEGFDPYEDSGALRLSNVRSSGRAEEVEITPLSGFVPLFGNNTFGATQFAEAYYAVKPAKIYGVYLVTPPAGKEYEELEVEVCIYSGAGKPETLLGSEAFRPAYLNRDKSGESWETLKPLDRSQESFIRFSTPVPVQGAFFVGYKIVSAPEDVHFTAYNLPDKTTAKNTAWFFSGGKWTEASSHPVRPMKTSLFIDPVIQYADRVHSLPAAQENAAFIFPGGDRRSLHVVLPEGVERAKLSVIAMNGKIVGEYDIPAKRTTLPVSSPAPGVYVAQLTYGSERYVQKVVF